MGSRVSKSKCGEREVKSKIDKREARALETPRRVRSIADFKYDAKDRHQLPIPGLQSRLSTALIWSRFDSAKVTLKTLLLLSRGSHAYIISQDGLRGFMPTQYEDFASKMFPKSQMHL